MKTLFGLGLAAIVSTTATFGQFPPPLPPPNTYNLTFELANVQMNDPTYGMLDWDLAVPFWNHSTGGDTHYVFYGREHLGLSQYYLLMSSTSPVYAPNTQLAGNYSLAFASGYASGTGAGEWINAFISQTLPISSTARSIQLLATGPFKVFVGGAEIPMISLGGDSFAGDITSFAGTTSELKIMNTTPEGFNNVHKPTVVDNIVFSTTVVPEPSALALISLGSLMLFTIVRKFGQK
jgi:hypothetical protein